MSKGPRYTGDNKYRSGWYAANPETAKRLVEERDYWQKTAEIMANVCLVELGDLAKGGDCEAIFNERIRKEKEAAWDECAENARHGNDVNDLLPMNPYRSDGAAKQTQDVAPRLPPLAPGIRNTIKKGN